jgi:hypothetical protein
MKAMLAGLLCVVALGTEAALSAGAQPAATQAAASARGDGRTLFITACQAVYKIQLRAAGPVPGP